MKYLNNIFALLSTLFITIGAGHGIAFFGLIQYVALIDISEISIEWFPILKLITWAQLLLIPLFFVRRKWLAILLSVISFIFLVFGISEMSIQTDVPLLPLVSGIPAVFFYGRNLFLTIREVGIQE